MSSENTISISMENTKMGPIPSFSLMPVETCACGVPCAVKGCYAKRMTARLKTVRESWRRNTAICRENLSGFVRQMNGWLAIYNPKAFRIHVAGDFFSDEYLGAWRRIALDNPSVKFFAFTKQFDIVRRHFFDDKKIKVPRNLSIILSAWTPDKNGWCPPVDLMRKFPVAFVVKTQFTCDDGHFLTPEGNAIESVRPKRPIHECSGHCSECGRCFNLKKKDGDILFTYH